MISYKFLILLSLSIFEASAQGGKRNTVVRLDEREPVINRIVYPSEDTNQNRKPAHVSEKVQ